MAELNAESGSNTMPIDTDDMTTNRSDDVKLTPLKKYVTFVENKRDKWNCNFGCRVVPYTGTYSRIRAHLIGLYPGQKAQGISLCSKVNKKERETMKKEEAEAKELFGEGKKAPLSIIPTIPTKGRKNTSNVVVDMFKNKTRSDVDEIIASFFYANGIPINVARSPFFIDMIAAVHGAPRGYKPPSAEKIRTVLLDKERSKVDQALMPLREQWPTYGVSIVSDGWTNIKNQSLINVMAISGGRAMFVSGIDCSSGEKTGVFISDLLLKAIENVGVYNVVQVLTDNASNCKTAGSIIETRYPHIFWTGCMAHSLSLLMKDIAHSKDPALAFVSNTYEQAKSIVKYIRNHGAALFIFRSFSHLEVIQVKKTRFGSHYVVLDRVVRVKNALINMVLNEEWEKIKKGRSNIEHDVVKKIILDDDFWNRAKLVLSFTKPIWLMIRFCDSDKAVIGQVYQRMEDMLDYVRVSLAGNLDILHVIEPLIMKRWEKMNYPLHSLAYVLTPYYYSKNWLRSLSPRGELRKKPHADNYIDAAYLNAVDRLISDRKEQTITRHQLSDFFANRGSFGRPQAIDDRETMDALAWWDMYGATSPELCSLAVKVLSQSVNTSCAERAWSTYSYIHSVKRNRLNADRAESLVFVHYNHRLLSRYRQDYEEAYKNWDTYANDDNLENNIEATEEREYNVLLAEDPRPSQASSTVPLASEDTPESSAAPAKRPRLE